MKSRPLALAAAALFLLSLVGLVTVKEDGRSSTVVAAAAATTRTGSAHIESATVFQGIGATASRATSSGVVDFGSGRAKTTGTTNGLGPVDSITGHQVAYVSATGPFFSGLGRGKQWIAFDLKALGDQASALTGGSGDPLAPLHALAEKGFVRHVEEQGTEEVRGVRTTKYVGDIDTDKLASVASGFLKTLLGTGGHAFGVQEARYTVWVAEDGRVRKCESAVSGTIATSRFSATTTTELFDFGPPVDIAVPPPEQVRRITSLQELAGR